MSDPEDETRAALRMLEPRIADFEARLHAAAAACAPGDPMLQSLRDSLQMLRRERQRLRDQLKQADS
jgi:histidinol-phosphate/aromatic aminotransferase/cobyric acid decarboxylase-like protein